MIRMIRMIRRHRPPAGRSGQILAPFAVVLLVLTALLTAIVGGVQERTDYDAIQARLQAAAVAGAGAGAAGSLVAGSPTLTCAGAGCAARATPCPDALAADPGGTSSTGQACLFLQQALHVLYGGPYARVDVADALAHARVAVAQDGQACPDAPARLYHFATLCLVDDPYIGILAHDGLGVRFHMVARAQLVYR